MPFRFNYQLMPDWPVAAWIAIGDSGSQRIRVQHGSRVETFPSWFGEIVWDGTFAQGNFDQTDIVFGSGATQNASGNVVFVGSASTLDRLHSLKVGGEWFVSNSLACLMATTQSRVDPTYAGFHRDFMKILGGIDTGQQSVLTDNGPIRLTYFRNLEWANGDLVEKDKPTIARHRNTLDLYLDFLETKICEIGENMRSGSRQHSLELLGTMSSGFDSPTVSAIGRKAGLSHVLTVSSSRGGQSDSGEVIAKQLGLGVSVIARDAWKDLLLPEIPFLSVDGKGEDVYFSPAANELKGKVLLTGYCGSLWGGRSSNYARLVRTDPSGLSLSEFRLWTGFINLPLALLGVNQAKDLSHLMQSSELQQWSRGRSYDKPFCRKVLTEAGVPEHMYGQEKKAASVLLEDRRSFLSQSSKADFDNYLQESGLNTIGHQLKNQMGWVLRRGSGGSQSVARIVSNLTGMSSARRFAKSVRLTEFTHSHPHFRHLFPWAIEHAKRRYQGHR